VKSVSSQSQLSVVQQNVEIDEQYKQSSCAAAADSHYHPPFKWPIIASWQSTNIHL
jgi:hypothetical protein